MGCSNSKSVSVGHKNGRHNRSSETYLHAVPSTGNASQGVANHNVNSSNNGVSQHLNGVKADSAVAATVSLNGAAKLNGSEDQRGAASLFLRSVLEGAEHLFTRLPDPLNVQQVVALTFMNSCVEVTRTKFRLKMDVITNLVNSMTEQLKLPLLQGSLSQVEERSTDDGFSRVLLAWYSNNPNFEKKISVEACQAVLDTMYIRCIASKPARFEDILEYHFHWASVNQAILELFKKFTDGKELMSPEQLGKFMRETQRIEVTDRQINEKYKYRLGGGIHRYNFASFNGSVLTNSAIDPTRTSDVWQDMTQSFTHYLVACVRVESPRELQRAMIEGTRTLVLNVHRGEGGVLLSGTCPLRDVLDGVRKAGFVTNTYPIILCLSPSSPMAIDVQEEVAGMLSDTLGPMLAKGLMFEGADINDPKFSPGALRKKVLVMSYQSPLKPFIGFMVADMIKDGLGVRVTDVVDGTPAAKGGVMKDDWLTHINGRPIQNKQHLKQSLATLKVGEEFTIKRENLDELKVVVGGMVDPNDTTVSTALSNLTFFRFAASEAPRPWDVVVLPGDALVNSALTRDELKSYFALASVNAATAVATRQVADKTPDWEGIASRMGVQFIDIDNSERCLAWSRGRFYDNGRCGYLLKTNLDPEKQCDLNVTIISGPRQLACPPLSTVAVSIHGTGAARTSGSQVTLTGCDEATVVVVSMTFTVDGGEHTYTAAFSPPAIRPGYRAIPCIAAGEEHALRKTIHSAYCFIKRN